MKSHLARLCAIPIAVTLAGLALTVAPTQAEPGAPGSVFTCNGTFTDRTFKNVKVDPGATCVLVDSVVTGNFMARRPATIRVLDTEVRHNLMVRGATEDVVIGNRDCRFDPVVGNNIKVTRSHNVAICWMTTKNNIQVTDNDGRISVFNNNAGRNISVSRNAKYVIGFATEGPHRNPGAIRVRHNEAGGHISLFNNHPGRRIFLTDNSPEPVVK